MPAGLVRSCGTNDQGLHVTTLYDPGDGSLTRVGDQTDGSASVIRQGPRDLWAPLEAAHRQWQELNRPRREWFGIEVTAREQTVHYTAPGGEPHRWVL
jgi:hypothetical protein